MKKAKNNTNTKRELYCPYCGRKAKMVTRDFVYGENARDKDEFMYICSGGCDAYVYCHNGTTKPMGKLANKELRQARIKAHKTMTIILNNGFMTKGELYKYLDVKMIAGRHFHIAESDLYNCNEAIRVMKNIIDIRTQKCAS